MLETKYFWISRMMAGIKSDIAAPFRPVRRCRKNILLVTCGCLLGYVVISVWSSWLSIPKPPVLPMTLREYFKRLSVEEDKWLVTYLPSNWTGGITHVLDIRNWGTIIVGEEPSTPPECISPKCFYIGPFEIDLLNFQSTRHLKENQKKLVGQMVAVILGAEHILPIEIDRVPLRHLSDVELVVTTKGLVHSGGSVFNPYTLQRHLVSSDHLFSHDSEIKSLLFTAIRSNGKRHIDRNLHLSSTSFIDLEHMDLIYSHDAFWAMIHPVMCSVLDYGVLNSFWIQKLIHAMGKTVTVFEPLSEAHSNSSELTLKYNPTDDFTADIIKSLNKFKCPPVNVQLLKCTQTLFAELIKKKLFSENSILILNDYYDDLQAINYHFPVIDTVPETNNFNFSLFISPKTVSITMKGSLVKYSNITKVCPGKKFKWYEPVIEDVLLIITFSKASDYKRIPILDLMYRRWFSHVLYCGLGVRGFTDTLSTLRLPAMIMDVYFVDGMDETGLFTQRCMMVAMVIDFKVKGYMQIKSDTLLNPWTLVNVPRDRTIVVGNMGTIDATLDKKEYWNWWEAKCGKRAWTKFFSFMEQTRTTESLSRKFLETFASNTNPKTAYYSGWNLFYIPSSMQQAFIHVASKTLGAGLMNELALATIVLGLDNKTSFYKIKDHSLWGTDSLNYDKLYNINDVFLYQFNLETELKTPKGKTFLCDVYLEESEKQLKRHKALI